MKIVSIPFKREGLSERKSRDWSDGTPGLVSIPFKREGLSEHIGMRTSCSYFKQTSFNSLQTGRTFRTLFLSNQPNPIQPTQVSIPFKREGLSEQSYSNR